MPFGFFVDLAALRARFSPATYDRGLALYRNQRVLACALSEPEGDGTWQIEGRVQGTQPEPYDVEVHLRLQASGRVASLRGDCSCPVGANCKHAAALTLKAFYQQARATDRAQEEGASAPARPPAMAMAHARLAQWLDEGDGAAPRNDLHGGEEEQSVYLLQVTQRGSGPATLNVAWRVAKRGKKGGWTKPRQPGYETQFRVTLRAQQGMEDIDAECVRLIQGLRDGGYGYGNTGAAVALRGRTGQWLLERCLATGRLYLDDGKGGVGVGPLTWGPARGLDWSWSASAGAPRGETLWQLSARLQAAAGVQADAGVPPARLFPGPPTLYLDEASGTCGVVAPPAGTDASHVVALLGTPPIPASAFAAAPVRHRLLMKLGALPLPPGIAAPEPWPCSAPEPRLTIAPLPREQRGLHGLMVAVLRFDYGGFAGWWRSPAPTVLVTHGEGAQAREFVLQRDLAAEAGATERLTALGLVGGDLGWYFQPHDAAWLQWAVQGWAPLREAGFTLDIAPELADWVQQVDALDVRMAGQGEAAGEGAQGDAPSPWFDLSLGIEIAGERRNILPWLPEWLAQVEQREGGPHLPEWLWREQDDGRWLRIPSAPLLPWLRVLLELVGERPARELESGALQLSRYEALRLAASLGEGAHWSGAETLRTMLTQLGSAGMLPEVAVPAGLQAELRPYQHQGLNWLQFLRANQLGGVLADDMGLGKTLQTLAHLLCEKQAGRMDRPCLVIVPVSLLGNWRREAERFAPSLRTRVWHGAARHEGPFAEDCDLLIAPYSLLQRDRERWLGQRWHVLILDEAQQVKNASTHAAQVVAQLDARQRLALTGTPMENHLGELWSLFHFLMPGFLGSARRFAELYRTPIEKLGDANVLAQLRRRITPFLLRRTKALVASELPPLIESTTTVTLEGAQADLYETIRLATEKAVRDALADKGLARSQIQVLDALLKLRQVCCDPRLVKSAAAARAKHSAKLDLLMELLPSLLLDGRRVLLFSQFTSMLTLIEERLAREGIAWSKLTGQTQKREAAIARFTSGEVPLFLISLKAGGTGLNLPQADTVIHYDPWWNPAVQAQATGRAHRIGQTQQVMVYKLVAEGTIEERILALQERKAELAAGVLSGAAGRKQPLFTESDVAELLRPLGA